MDIVALNNSLKRPIRQGFHYDKYFEDASCNPVFLGKGNTDFSLQLMRDWVKKYAYQTKKLALNELNGNTILQIRDKIHAFLYDHIQYEIDTKNQNLKSPACAWATRKKGNDCKSYSIFASTILTNLGIEHCFRKIKQPHLMPNKWTHVYVVIYLNQNGKKTGEYVVIDATVRPNTEVLKTQYKDLFMSKLPHYGLNSPNMLAACACHEKPQIYDMGLGVANPTTEKGVLEVGVARFHSFLDDLEAKGLPPEVSNMAIKRLEKYINEGVEPKIADVFGVIEIPAGLGLAPLVATAPTAGGGVLKGITSVAGLLGKLIPKDFFGKTFGAVFANGFNLSCWNSTFTPSKVAAEVQKYHIPLLENAIQNVVSASSTIQAETALNYLLYATDVMYTMYAKYMINGANWRSCSREAINIYVDIVTGAKAQVDMLLKQMKSQYNISESTKSIPAELTFPKTLTGALEDFKWSEKQHGNATYRVVKINTQFEDLLDKGKQIGTGDNAPTGTVSSFIDDEGYTNYIDENGEVIKREKKVSKAGFGFLEAGLLTLAIGGIAYANKKKKAKS